MNSITYISYTCIRLENSNLRHICYDLKVNWHHWSPECLDIAGVWSWPINWRSRRNICHGFKFHWDIRVWVYIVSHCLSDCLSVTVFLVVCQWLSSWSSVSDCLPGCLSVTVFLVVCQSLSSWSSVSDCLPGRLSGISNLCPRQQCTETRPGFEKLKVHSF